MKDLENAKACLSAGGHTCVLCKGAQLHTSRERGVRPLVAWYASKQDFSGFCAADKVVGKATAFLYVLLGVQAVYAGILSRSAQQVLTAHGIWVESGSLVENIRNRSGDGICPFEQTVLQLDDPHEAYLAIRAKMAQMHIVPEQE